MFRGWNWNEHWGRRIFSPLSLPTLETLKSQTRTEATWVTGLSHPRCKSDHGACVCALGWNLPRAIWKAIKVLFCVGSFWETEGYSIFPADEPPTKNSKQYAPFITFWTCVGVHFCRCNTDVVKALYWIIFMKFVRVFYEGVKIALLFPLPNCLCLPFDGYLWQYTTCSWMD